MTFRVAAVQLAVGDDVDANVSKCLHFLEEAARAGAQLAVFPEFCHLPSAFRSGAQAHAVAVTDDHPFLASMQAGARRHGLWVAVNAFEKGPFPQVFDTTFLVSSDGELAGRYRKHLLFGPERNWITPGRDGYPVFATPYGRIGLFTCMDGLIPEPARCLAVKGAQVLLDCLNSGGRDEPALHIPVRALENGVWIVAANKVGPVAHGAAVRYIGGSMIVAPDGNVVAQADDSSETVVVAEIDVAQADRSRLRGRRPAAYAMLHRPAAGRVQIQASSATLEAKLNDWTVRCQDGEVVVLGPGEERRTGYRSVHADGGDRFVVVPTPFGNVGLSTGDDLWYPEAARCLALEGADLLIHFGEWHDLLLVERAAENRICALAIGPTRCGVVRLGPLQTEPHWLHRQPFLESGRELTTELDLQYARLKGDQLAGRCAEDCESLVCEEADAPQLAR